VVKLLKYLKGAYLISIIAPLMMALEVAMDLMQPALIAKIIDIGIANNDINYVWYTGGKMLLVALIGLAGGIGCGIFAPWAGMHFGANLRQAIFDKIQTFSFKELDDLQTSSLIIRITNDVTQMQNLILMLLRIMVRAPLLCIGGIVMAVIMSPRLSVIFLVSMPVLIMVVLMVVRKSFPLFTKVQEKIDRVNTVMRENLMGVRVIKAYVSHEKEKKRFKAANEDLMDISIRAQKATIIMWPVVTLVMNFSVIAVLWFGGRAAINSEIEIGKIIAFINYLLQILFSLIMVSMLVIGASRAKASADRINEVLEREPSVTEPENPSTTEGYEVEFRDVAFKYYSSEEEPVLKNINFTAREGETIGIIGATGSGKSTLINLILRLYDVTEGQVLIGGKDIRNLSQSFLRDTIGVVLQDNILFTGTVEENLRWGNAEADFEALDKAARDAQAYEFISTMEKGYNAGIEQRGKNLSGGQKQRMSIARALLKNPKILIMDDSTSALDMATEAKLQQALKKRMGTCTLFIIAQRISSVIEADKIIVLDNGSISAIGKHNELIGSSSIYRSIVESQLGKVVVVNG
jgi:ATP-binding cassette, subfamily B, multidrug efflux pump